MLDAPEPQFLVQNIPIQGDVVLAPMVGVTDLPFRTISRELGSAMSYTEFINAIEVMNGHPHLAGKLLFNEAERPVIYQIFDNQIERLVRAALILQEKKPDIIDINLGCSVKTVSNRGAGAGLLQNPDLVAQMIYKLSRSLEVPVTAKIRLGWDEASRNYLQIARIIEENGGQLIAVHGRTRSQAYRGIADWDAIAEVKQAVNIPVIGNGDINSVDDIDRMKAHTNCDAVMIGRAAIGNPWILSRKERKHISIEQSRLIIERHLYSMTDFYGLRTGVVLFRKHANRYIAPYNPTREQRKQLLTTSNPEIFLDLFDQFFLS
jgi:tRNA-dihydrouridine synthase B